MVSSSSSSPLDPSSAQQQADCQGVQTSPDSTSHGTEQVSQGGFRQVQILLVMVQNMLVRGVQTSPDFTVMVQTRLVRGGV